MCLEVSVRACLFVVVAVVVVVVVVFVVTKQFNVCHDIHTYIVLYILLTLAV